MADSDFVQYYQRELAYSRALAQQFAEKYPEVAYLTSEAGGDPAAERLFEGAALLTARLRQRIEDDLPEISHPLFARLWPQYLRPLPAVSLLRFTGLPNAAQRSQSIARGTMVYSRASDSVPSCPFQTTAEFELLPAVLESAQLVRQRVGDLQLRLRLELGNASLDQAHISRLRVQFFGDEVIRYTLYAWACQATSFSIDDESGATILSVPGSRIRPVGLLPGESLCGGEPTPIAGLDLLRDYFVLPEKYLGVEVQGLDQPLRQRPASAHVDCIFHLGPLPEPGFSVGLENVALGCVPVVNLSESAKIDVAVPPGSYRFHLELGQDAQVFTVDRVRAYDNVRREWIDIAPLDMQGVGPQEEQGLRFVVLHLQDGVAGVQTYLAITDEEARPVSPRTDSLQVWVTRSDGSLPVRLGPRTVTVASASSPGFATFTNPLPVRPGQALRLYQDRLWHLLAELAMHPSDLCSLNGLRLILREVQGDRAASGHEPLKVGYELSTTLHRRTVVPLRKLELVFSDESFAAPGQLLLFGRLVSRLYTPARDSTTFSEVIVRGEPSGVEYRFWLPPAG